MTSMSPSSNDRLSQDALPLASPSGGKASVASCIINLASTCMGTGILALPSAYHLGGFASGTLLCIASAGLCSTHCAEPWPANQSKNGRCLSHM